jgi:hypothetical protein
MQQSFLQFEVVDDGPTFNGNQGNQAYNAGSGLSDMYAHTPTSIPQPTSAPAWATQAGPSTIVPIAQAMTPQTPPPAGPAPGSLIELTGIVTQIKPGKRGEALNFVVLAVKMNREFQCSCPPTIFCPLHERDSFYAVCTVLPGNMLQVARPPFVQMPVDREGVMRCFIRILRGSGFGNIKAGQLYDSIAKMANEASNANVGRNSGLISNELTGAEKAIAFLSETSINWLANKDPALLAIFCDVLKEGQAKRLLIWWHKDRNLRRLYLFGLTNKEINACHMPLDEVYQRCLNNPLTIPALSLEKCQEILQRSNRQASQEDLECGQITRQIWKNLTERAWTATPLRFLLQQFPLISQHEERLIKDYEVVFEHKTVYLAHPHKVEVEMTQRFVEMVLNDPVAEAIKTGQEMPFDEEVIVSCNGKECTVRREAANYTIPASEDQQAAVQGALDHSVSIITGSAGTGKCLDPETPILMFDGTVKPIKHVDIGEQVMGPDSRPRTVLSTCMGDDEMFQIIPSKGNRFTCNAPHILTLVGIVPYISFRKDRGSYIVRYTERGYPKSKTFRTEEDAQICLNSLPQDIFDIPLNEFMTRTEHHQRYCYLYHVGVEFPQQNIPFDPYLLGYWLGDGHSSAPVITTADPEIVDVFSQLLQSYNLTLTQSSASSLTYYIVGAGENHGKKGTNMFGCALRALNLINNKHIPSAYKINSRQIRLLILAGLIDSDGYRGDNYIEITQKNKQLADDIEYLALSLGFMVTSAEVVKGCEYLGEMRYGTYTRLNIFGEGLEQIPVVLARKKCDPRKAANRANCLRFSVKPLGRGSYFGFELDLDGRFLLGDFLVTHNSSCISQLVHNLELRGVAYALCSFTGKAVARIKEITKKGSAMTIHRLMSRVRALTFSETVGGKKQEVTNPENISPNIRVLIIDECSMVTSPLMHQLLSIFDKKGIKDLQIILIGDINQLPPIGWGSLFSECIKSGTIPLYRLINNHRMYNSTRPNGEPEINAVIANAEAIIHHNEKYMFEFIGGDNFFLIDGSKERVYDMIQKSYQSGVRPEQLCIVSPYNRDLDELNGAFQQIYNDGKRSVTDSRSKTWCLGDRVMLLKNDYDIDVFNGEQGYITDLNETTVMVDFGNSGKHEFLLEPAIKEEMQGAPTEVKRIAGLYQYEGVDEGDGESAKDERTVLLLAQAAALTVHKSQGSEWDFVIFYVPFMPGAAHGKSGFLNRNLVYTAITRAKRAVYCIGDIEGLRAAVNKGNTFRCENMVERLKTGLPSMVPALPEGASITEDGSVIDTSTPAFGMELLPLDDTSIPSTLEVIPLGGEPDFSIPMSTVADGGPDWAPDYDDD